MVGARRAIASRVGATVVGKRELRAAADVRGQPRPTMQARDDCKNKTKSRESNNPHHMRDRCIFSYHKIVQVPYRTLQNTIILSNTHVIITRDRTIIKTED